jgi:hypothetical protein
MALRFDAGALCVHHGLSKLFTLRSYCSSVITLGLPGCLPLAYLWPVVVVVVPLAHLSPFNLLCFFVEARRKQESKSPSIEMVDSYWSILTVRAMSSFMISLAPP